MKIKLDENMPTGLKAVLSSAGHNVDTAHEEGVAGKDDTEVWNAAQQTGRFLITQDLDFSDARSFVPGKHAGLLLVRLREPSRVGLLKRISELFINEATDEWPGCFIVVTDHKIRIRRKRPPDEPS